MSQDYINSLWRVEEFEDCYMENMKDPAFKLFVIFMQPADTLNVTNEYIKSFFAKRTYLERDDFRLFNKIAEYLIQVKHPKGNKPLPEGLTDQTNDPLLRKNDHQNDAEVNYKGIIIGDHRKNINLRNLDNKI